MERKELCSAVLVASIVSAEHHAIEAGLPPEPHVETEITTPVANPNASTSEGGSSRTVGIPYGLGPYGVAITTSRDGKGDSEKMLAGTYG
jgi:hypothetical protein